MLHAFRLPLVHEAANGDFEILRRVRFEEYRVTPGPQCALRSGGKRSITGDGEYRDVRGPRVLPQAPRELEAVDPGNVQIGDDHVGRILHSTLERLKAIVRLNDAEPRVSEPFRVHQAAFVVVFDEQNAWA